MDRRSGSRDQVFWPTQFGAASDDPNRPGEQPPHSAVQGLKHALDSAITEIKCLREENKALMEQVGLLGNRQEEVTQLQEELKQKDDLLKRITKKWLARTRAHVEILDLLAQKEKELKRSEEQWKSTCDALEASIMSKNNQLEKLAFNTKEQEQSEKKKQSRSRRSRKWKGGNRKK